MNKTEHYQLNQWQLHDRVMMQDFNADSAKLDAALADHDSAFAAVNAALAKRGNCRIDFQSYTGNGQYGSSHPTVLTFSGVPAVFFAVGGNTIGIFKGGASTGQVAANVSGVSLTSVSTSWSGSTVRISHSGHSAHQLNLSGTTYWIIALYKMD